MAKACAFLALLLLVLTFNAYACMLPLRQHAGMDCDSCTHQPVRQTCDAFLLIGPQSEISSDHVADGAHFDLEINITLPVTDCIVRCVDEVARAPTNPTHLSIPTTVLRI